MDGGEAPDPTGVSQVVDTPPEQDAAESTQMTGEEIEDDGKDQDVSTLAKCLPLPPPSIAAPTAEECSSARTMPDSSFCSPEEARSGSISPSGGLLLPSASGWHIAGKRSSATPSVTAATKRARIDSGGPPMVSSPTSKLSFNVTSLINKSKSDAQDAQVESDDDDNCEIMEEVPAGDEDEELDETLIEKFKQNQNLLSKLAKKIGADVKIERRVKDEAIECAYVCTLPLPFIN